MRSAMGDDALHELGGVLRDGGSLCASRSRSVAIGSVERCAASYRTSSARLRALLRAPT
jgi:hypothetical protein